MTYYSDEEFAFRQDEAEKAHTGRSAFNRRSHGGTVRLPSDNLTKKELEKMNGECKSYNINNPMAWKEFKELPDDLKVMYIKLIRKRYNPSISEMARTMFRVDKHYVCNELRRLGLETPRRGRNNWNEDGWCAWLRGKKFPVAPDSASADEEAPTEGENNAAQEKTPPETILEPVATAEPAEAADESELVEAGPVPEIEPTAIPHTGTLTFDGEAMACLGAVSAILGNTRVQISIAWRKLAETEGE